jgi:dihydrofolate reductase
LLPLTLIVAVADNGGIGLRGGLPWDVPEDVRHFKRATMGHAIIMGRRTWEEVGRPLPGRRNVVVSRDPSFRPEGAVVARSFDEALALARQTDEEPFVIGGAGIYAAALPLATRLLVTEIHREVEADTFFPAFDRSLWREAERRAGGTPGVEFVTYLRADAEEPDRLTAGEA